jgi:hypothetical protein
MLRKVKRLMLRIYDTVNMEVDRYYLLRELSSSEVRMSKSNTFLQAITKYVIIVI